jgi:general secretion pathway protein K
MKRKARVRERGMALVLVVWIFMILGVLALDFAEYMRDDAMSAVNMADETRGYYIALAGLNRAVFDRERHVEGEPERTGIGTRNPRGTTDPDDTTAPEELVPPDGEWHEADFAGGRWKARMVDQEAVLALNMLRPNNPVHEALLRHIVKNLVTGGNATRGVDRRMQSTIDTVTDSILDWRDRDSVGDEEGGGRRGRRDATRANGAESDFYLKRRPPYRAKNWFFDSPEELLMVRGVTPALFYGVDGAPGLRDVVSAYLLPSEGHAEPRINLQYASPAMLQVLLGLAPEELEEYVLTRKDGASLEMQAKARLTTVAPELADWAQANLGDFEPRVVLIEARGDVKSERNQSRVAALVRIKGEGEGISVLRWLDRAPWDAPLPGMPVGAEDGTA